MQTKTLFFGLTLLASALAAPVTGATDKTVTTQSSGAGIWKRAEDAEMHTSGAGIWKREEDGEMHTTGAGIWKREEVEARETDGEMHTTGAGIWKKAEVCYNVAWVIMFQQLTWVIYSSPLRALPNSRSVQATASSAGATTRLERP